MENLTVELTPEETALIMILALRTDMTKYPVLSRSVAPLVHKLNEAARKVMESEGYGKANFDPNRDTINFLDETDGHSRGSESNS